MKNLIFALFITLIMTASTTLTLFQSDKGVIFLVITIVSLIGSLVCFKKLQKLTQ